MEKLGLMYEFFIENVSKKQEVLVATFPAQRRTRDLIKELSSRPGYEHIIVDAIHYASGTNIEYMRGEHRYEIYFRRVATIIGGKEFKL